MASFAGRPERSLWHPCRCRAGFPGQSRLAAARREGGSEIERQLPGRFDGGALLGVLFCPDIGKGRILVLAHQFAIVDQNQHVNQHKGKKNSIGYLRKDEDFVAFLHERFEEVEQGVELGALSIGGLGADERGVAADLPQSATASVGSDARAVFALHPDIVG